MGLQKRVFRGLKQGRKRDRTKQPPMPFLSLQAADGQDQLIPIQMFSLRPQEEKALDAQRDRGAGKAPPRPLTLGQIPTCSCSSRLVKRLPYPLASSAIAQDTDDVLGTRVYFTTNGCPGVV